MPAPVLVAAAHDQQRRATCFQPFSSTCLLGASCTAYRAAALTSAKTMFDSNFTHRTRFMIRNRLRGFSQFDQCRGNRNRWDRLGQQATPSYQIVAANSASAGPGLPRPRWGHLCRSFGTPSSPSRFQPPPSKPANSSLQRMNEAVGRNVNRSDKCVRVAIMGASASILCGPRDLRCFERQPARGRSERLGSARTRKTTTARSARLDVASGARVRKRQGIGLAGHDLALSIASLASYNRSDQSSSLLNRTQAHAHSFGRK
jgi:hypothetical protein